MTYPEFVAIFGAVLFWGVILLLLADIYYSHFLYPCIFRMKIIRKAKRLQLDAEAIRDAEPREEGGRFIVSTIIAGASSMLASSPESLLEQQFDRMNVFDFADGRIKIRKSIDMLSQAGFPDLAALIKRASDLRDESVRYNAPFASLLIWLIALCRAVTARLGSFAILSALRSSHSSR